MDNRVARCHLLVEVLTADGIMTEDERALLEKHMEAHELSDEERHQVRNFESSDGAIAALRDRPEIERQEILDQLVEAALADHKLTKNENEAVRRIAIALGLES